MSSPPSEWLSIFFQIALEGVERGIPKRADLRQFLDERLDPLAAARREFVNPFPPDFLRLDEPGFSEHPRMLDDRGAAHRKTLRKLASAAGLLCEAAQQFAAGG